uniref:Putative secreted protein n=1 Tax=Ixodes ricinus TaxID=34613 RepID=A0A6B0UVU0_IXORI
MMSAFSVAPSHKILPSKFTPDALACLICLSGASSNSPCFAPQACFVAAPKIKEFPSSSFRFDTTVLTVDAGSPRSLSMPLLFCLRSGSTTAKILNFSFEDKGFCLHDSIAGSQVRDSRVTLREASFIPGVAWSRFKGCLQALGGVTERLLITCLS